MVCAAAKLLHDLKDSHVVCCTSGPGTGTPLEADRRELYRQALGHNTPISVASGTTNDNVQELLPFIDIFLVATGIEKDPTDPQTIAFYKEAGIPAAEVGYLDPEKLRAMAEAIHSFED